MKILVSYLLAIFLKICYGANDCSLENGGLIITSITEPLKSPVNPHWSDEYKKLYFADENTSKVYMYDPKTKKLDEMILNHAELEGQHIKHFLPAQSFPNDYWLITGNQLIAYSRNYNEVDVVKNVTEKRLTVKQGRTDNKHHLFLGTEPNEDPKRPSSDLIKFYGDLAPVAVLSKGISSQVAFNSDYTKILTVDEVNQQISIGDYDAKPGVVDKGSIRTVFDASNSEIQGKIADAHFDNQENIWIAYSDSGKIIKYNYKENKNECEMTMPVKGISGMTWGGAKWDKLYVTTRQGDDPASGSVYCVSKLDAVGVPYTDF